MKRLLRCLSVFALAIPTCASAQADAWSLTFHPRAGVFIPEKDVGNYKGEGVHLSQAPVLGASVELTTPLQWVQLRATGWTTVSASLDRKLFDGWESCARDCHREATGRNGALMNFSVDGVLTPSRTWAVQPYAVAGVGAKRFDFGNQRLVASDPASDLGGATWGAGINTGFGLELPVAGARLTMEAVDYMSGIHGYAEDGADATQPFRSIRHDIVFSMGVRLVR